jgi:hypothetical protein
VTISERATAGIGHNKPPANICPCCGQEKPSPRNAERHKLFFAILKPALEQWPHGAVFEPISTEHLRAWLLYKSGWCNIRELEIGGPAKKSAIAAVRYFLDDKDRYRFFTDTARGIREYTPKSIAWNRCKEAEFKRILDESGALIESIIGVPIEQLKREKAA